MTRSSLGKKRVYFAYTTILQLIVQGSQGRNSSSQSGTEAGAMEDTAYWICSACFLISSRVPSQVLSPVARPSHINHQSKNYPVGLPEGQPSVGNISLEVSSSQMTIFYVNSTENLIIMALKDQNIKRQLTNLHFIVIHFKNYVKVYQGL